MKRYHREISFLIICLMIVSGFVSLFFRHMEQEKQRLDCYALIPERANAILRIKERKTGTDIARCKEMERFLPKLFGELMGSMDLNEWIFSFHEAGVVCYVKTSHKDANRLKNTLSSLLGSFPPEKVCKYGVSMEYYADLNGKFIGTFQKGGYWVASYNSPLLTKALQKTLYSGETPSIYSSLEKKKGKSGADVWIFTPLIDVDIQQPDSSHWSISQPWFQADIYRKGTDMIAFSALSPKAYNDSTASVISDSVRNKIAHLLQICNDSLLIQHTQDDKYLYLQFKLNGETPLP